MKRNLCGSKAERKDLTITIRFDYPTIGKLLYGLGERGYKVFSLGKAIRTVIEIVTENWQEPSYTFIANELNRLGIKSCGKEMEKYNSISAKMNEVLGREKLRLSDNPEDDRILANLAMEVERRNIVEVPLNEATLTDEVKEFDDKFMAEQIAIYKATSTKAVRTMDDLTEEEKKRLTMDGYVYVGDDKLDDDDDAKI